MPHTFMLIHTPFHVYTHPHRPNEEKIVYFLLLFRKERQPSVADEPNAALGSHQLGECCLSAIWYLCH